MPWIKSESLSKIAGVVHGFSNRNFDRSLSDAARDFGLIRIATLNQIHSSSVLIIKDEFDDGSKQKGDAIITNLKGVGVAVFTADCVPILFADDKASVVAVAHAGWRGTLSQIANNTILEIVRNFGLLPSEISAVIGPSIGGCCYEVGEDVASLFSDKFADHKNYLFRKTDSKYLLDLKEANRTELIGQSLGDVRVLDVCTKCNNDFHSYRRDGKDAGRQISLIGLV